MVYLMMNISFSKLWILVVQKVGRIVNDPHFFNKSQYFYWKSLLSTLWFSKFFRSALVLEIVPGRICANFEYEIKWKKCSTWNSYTIEHTTMPFSSVLKIHLIVLLLTNLLKNRWPLIGEIIERRMVFSKRAFILSNKFSSDYLYILLCIVMFHIEQHSIEINISKFRLVPF